MDQNNSHTHACVTKRAKFGAFSLRVAKTGSDNLNY